MDNGEILILGKLLLTFGVLLGIPAWELWRLRRDRRRSGAGNGDGDGRPVG
jgi:hypothetical protein